MADKIQKLPILTEDNYSTWRDRLKSLLQQRKLWDTIEPGYNEDDEDDNGELTPRKLTKNNDALNLIKQATNDYTFHFIKKETRARTAWEILSKTFCDYSAIDVVDLMDNLFLMRKTDDQSMMQYIVRNEEVLEKLEEAGVEFKDSVKGAMLLRGLPRDEYKMFIMQFRVNDEQMSAANVKGRLIKEGRKEKLKQLMKEDTKKEDSEDEDQPKAYRTKHQSGNYSKSNQYQQSSNNNSQNYQKRGQGQENNQERRQSSSSWSPQCFFCDGMGHVIRYWPKLREKKAQKIGGAAKQVNYEEGKESEKKEDPEPKDGGAAKVVKFRALQAKRSNVPLERNKMYEWVGDSGATHHMTPFREIIENFNPNVVGTVEVADGEFIEAKGAGKITMLVSDECGEWKLQFNEVIYVPDLDSNLISIIQLDNKGFEIKIKNGILMVMEKEDTLFKAKNNYGDAYILNCNEYVVNNMNKKKEENSKEHGKFGSAKARRTVLWHDRLGHMTSLPPVCGKEKCPPECEVCPQGKMNRKKFTLSTSRGSDCLDLVHSDVMGKISPPTIAGCKYVVTFLDDFSRYSQIYLMKEKSEVFGHFKNFVAAAEAILEKKLKRFQSDNGTEYRNENFKEYTQERGIQHRFSVVRTQQQNGRAERLNKTLFNIVRCILIKANLPKYFWGEAVMYAN